MGDKNGGVIRGRAAPSPTGRVHIGNMRTFLFNSLFIRHNNGINVLRVEDTDQKRSVEKGLEGIIEVLEQYGITFQEGPHVGGEYGPYVQTERKDSYKEVAEKLVNDGNAYYCFCSSERLAALREDQVKNKVKPGYDRHCRDIASDEARKRVEAGESHVIRLKFPTEGEFRYDDIVFGELKFKNKDMEDIVILKSDGLPTYNFGVVVDDHAMAITHAMRAREYLSEIPKNIFIYRSLGWEPARYIHVPEVLNPDGKGKLSKRKGALPAISYLRKGYLVEAMINFLALLGWSPSPENAHEDEIYSEDELVKFFDESRINRAPARFDQRKLDYMNGKHIRAMSIDQLADRVVRWAEDLVLKEFITDMYEEKMEWEVALKASVESALPKWKADMEYFKKALTLVHERLVYLSEIPELLNFIYADELEMSDEVWNFKNHDKAETAAALKGVLPKLDEVFANGVNDHEAWEESVRGYADEIGWKHGDLFMAIRSATTGAVKSPPLFESFQVMGWEKGRGFMEAAVKYLES
ncbi:MAG: glutamate--tRNA ligase [Candidatus Dojkabacteria bacterium]|nr:MAG: glutamate--tRNA ligase [Candidatus Dojkabacteria bacterium]